MVLYDLICQFISVSIQSHGARPICASKHNCSV